MFSNHPFVQTDSHNIQVLPPQMLPQKEKDERWKRKNMDALEYIARIQWLSNQRFYNNYKLVNGEFIMSDYMGEGVNDLLKDFDVPSYIKNYDIISQPLNTMVGELDTYPDTFIVVGKGEHFEGEVMRLKSELLQKYLMSKIEQDINNKLIERGLDPNLEDFESEEEKQVYQQQINQQKEEIMNPMQIQSWLNTKYRHVAEIWGETELEDQKERFNLVDVRRTEFKDLLITGRRFRHIFLKANGFGIESLNPINVFYHKSPEVKYVQNGDYVGQIHILSLPAIIDRYGYKMTKKQLESLQGDYAKDYKGSESLTNTTMTGSPINYLSPNGIPYATAVQSLSRYINDFTPQVKDFPATNWFMNDITLDKINGGDNFLNAINGMFQVTEAYWKSQKMIKKLVWVNPETNTLEKVIIDENFIVPSYIKEVQGTIDFDDETDEINTVTCTYINEIWKGVKISNAGTHSYLKEPMYLDISRHDIQFKGETLIYEPVLPIGGQIVNNRNTVSSGLVDLLKPYQVLHNLLMNQFYNYVEKEIIPFILMDVNLIPNSKNWGGKDNLEKWMRVAKSLGVVPADSSPANMQGANAGGQLPKVIDLDMSARIQTRLAMANAIRQLALEQVGIAPQRLGDIKSSETATGITQATNRSYTQTSSWFTEFFACERELLKMQLSIAQTLQSKGKDILASSTKSDLSNAFLKFNDDEFSLYDLHIYLSNSQEELRKLDMIRRLGVENNTLMTKLSDRMLMATSNSIPEITRVILTTEKEEDDRKKREQEMQQKQLDQQKQIADDRLQQERQLAYDKMQNDLEREYIKANAFNENLGQDTNGNTIPDVLEQLKYVETVNNNNSKLDLDKSRLQHEVNLQDSKLNLENKKLQLESLKEQNKLIIEKEKLKRAKVQGDKSK